MTSRSTKRPHGQVRQGQMVTTFGPGSLLDLPNHSVLIGGLEGWLKGGEEIHELRLVQKLERILGVPNLKIYPPPPESGELDGPRTGITVWQFPEWFISQDVEGDGTASLTRSRLLVPRRALSKGKYIDRDKKKRRVVPVRFVRACRRGHISDIDWYSFAHEGDTECRRQGRQLLMDERGTSGDLAEVWVRCECGRSRVMSQAARMELQALGRCNGSRPWLGPYMAESCGEPSRLLVRSASNAYFPQLLSVISLPDRDEALVKAVDQVWENFLEYVESVEDLKSERKKKPPVKNALDGFSDEQVFEEIQSRKAALDQRPAKTVKQAELETLVSSLDEIGHDRPDGDFYARALPLSKDVLGLPLMAPVERVVLVHRLREVVAQVGFTRFESAAPDIEGELDVGVTRAALARETSWLPAIENRGEGIFIQFRRLAIEEWFRREAVVARGGKLTAGFDAWHGERPGSHRKFPGLPYILLHSLSHLLITSMSLECGYPASSIRERVYAGAAGFGILLYTASPDAEGTLGGLVESGRQIHKHLQSALELGELCSNDPICAQHAPENANEHRFLQGAACHGCLLIAETSCEQHNDFLDRALVVPTVDERETAFFQPGAP